MAQPAPAPAYPRHPAPTAPCPLTGEPSRLVQAVSVKFLEGLWRMAAGAEVARHYPGMKKLGLYEAPCGLHFFYPMIAGDGAFYKQTYEKIDAHEMLNRDHMQRMEFVRAAAYVPAGGAVADVGCGAAMFRDHVKGARYQGVDPYAEPDAPAWIAREDVEAHADKHTGAYDVACAFQVLEHVDDPLGFARQMVRCLKPGGVLVLCAPLHPSQLTEIPNNPVNGPPHHLTWWNRGAYEALCRELGLEVLEITALEPSAYQKLFFWFHRLMPFKTDPKAGVYYASSKPWAIGMYAAYGLSKVVGFFGGMPKTARPVDIFLAARKAG